MNNKRIDYSLVALPVIGIVSLSCLFFVFPSRSNAILTELRFFFGDTFGSFYIILGVAFIAVSVWLCMSRYGDIVLGDYDEKPKYHFFVWGSMMFTCGLAADILFYSFSEWIMYGGDPYLKSLGTLQEWAGVFPLFHWSFIPWSFYLVLAVAFGFMIHVRKRKRKRFSEACRCLIGNHTDKMLGRFIDLLAIFALLAGTATTFSVATPLISISIKTVFGIELSRNAISIIIIVLTCFVYTYSLLHGITGISVLSKVCIYLFFGMMVVVLLTGGNCRYIFETGIESFGRMIHNFLLLSTHIDPLRESTFSQDWTIYYWAYWMVWCVAAPFFIGEISRGRTVRQVIVGGYVFGVGSTIVSFVVFGNYSLGLQVSGMHDFLSMYQSNFDAYAVIIEIIKTLPYWKYDLFLIILTMIAFYATSFDSIAFTAACYSYKSIEEGENPSNAIQLLWCILLIVLPIALVFSESSMNNIQTISIISAFPLGIVMVMIVTSFIKDANEYLKERNNNN